MLLPPMTGIMIMHADKQRHKAIASAIGQFSYNLLGYTPAPYFYGLLVTIFPKMVT